jgi:hypothetical protein
MVSGLYRQTASRIERRSISKIQKYTLYSDFITRHAQYIVGDGCETGQDIAY